MNILQTQNDIGHSEEKNEDDDDEEDYEISG
jgi:hypothetical protein